MKKTHTYICLLLLVSFAQINGTEKEPTTKDYSKMSINELGESLVTAVRRNNQDDVKNLIRAGANPDQEITYTHSNYDDYDSDVTCSILEYASRCGDVDIVIELLKAKPTIDAINKALILAAQGAEVDVVRELANHASKKYRDLALMKAAEKFPGYTPPRNRSTLKNYLDVIRLLVQAGANVNCTDKYGDTPLIKIIEQCIYTEKQKKNRAEIIDVLLKAGAQVNHASKIGDRALGVAIKKHDLDAVQILLQTPKININYVDNNGNTPFIIAVQCLECSYISGDADQYNDCVNSQKIVEALFATPGINHHHANKNGYTAINLLEKVAQYS